MGDWWRSAGLLFWGILRRSSPLLLLLFLDVADVYGRFIAPRFPSLPDNLSMPTWAVITILVSVVLWAAISTHHELRTKHDKLVRNHDEVRKRSAAQAALVTLMYLNRCSTRHNLRVCFDLLLTTALPKIFVVGLDGEYVGRMQEKRRSKEFRDTPTENIEWADKFLRDLLENIDRYEIQKEIIGFERKEMTLAYQKMVRDGRGGDDV